jgi:7-carboxy-7-deazaguanine synthase
VALKVNEIFYSIQGESSYAGRACVFIRLTGCNLRCSYCDTRYAYEQGEDLEIDAIVRQVSSHQCPLVQVTGGEPLIQSETPVLVQKLLAEDYEVLLETNGTQDIGQVDERCVKILDVKCPSSGEADKNDLRNLGKLREKDELKFVIGNRDDYEYAKGVLGHEHETVSRIHAVHFSPVFGKMDPRGLAEWILEDRLNVRLQIQMHKVIWDPDQRGV